MEAGQPMNADTSAGRRPVMMDIARIAGVSQKTVSRVVNNSPNVSDEVRARVLAVIESVGFRPNSAARALVNQKSKVIGIVTLGSALYGAAAQVIGVERSARLAGYSTLLVSTNDGTVDQIESAIQQVLDREVDGVILSEPVDDSRINPDLLGHTPIVSLGSGVQPFEQQVVVGYDQFTGGRRATEHLLALGHRTVWHIAGPPDFPASKARANGWQFALEQAGAIAPMTVSGDWTALSGYRAGQRLAKNDEITAIFVANDRMAMGVIRALIEVGKRVPDDVSVVGFDDLPEAEFQVIPLTTMRQDYEKSAQYAVRELVQMMRGLPPSERTIDLQPELIVRQSSGVVRGG
jgi:DNA-binding LacI/PurR family transcriptional regulator